MQPGPESVLRPPETGLILIWVLIRSFSDDTWEMIPGGCQDLTALMLCALSNG